MKKNKGFTLIELLVVIAIIGILAILIFIALQRAQAAARDSQRKAFARDLASAEAIYYDQAKKYGTIDQLDNIQNDLIGQYPPVCPDGKDTVTDCSTQNGSKGAWRNAMSDIGVSTWKVEVNLERGTGTFTCDQSGCRD